MGNFKDLTKRRFGRLITIEPTEERRNGSVVWDCICDCGEKHKVSSSHLQSGNTKSCGCLGRERLGKERITHGMTKTPTYRSWDHMIQRCTNPNNRAYKYYGGRGIKICKRWHKFEYFLEDMGLRPKGKSLDRYPDNDGNYGLSNCRWATRKEQMNNARPDSCGPHKQYFFYGHGPNGEMIIENNQSHVARVFGLVQSSISGCISGTQRQTRGWTFERI